jgi:pimeloyl-ACP methyl ester carboxylesterase
MRKTIVFLHGGPGYPDYLQSIFKDQFPDFNTVFYTQSQLSFNKLMQELDETILDNGWVYLVGHSFGATLALEYLRQNPASSVLKLVLISPCLSTEHFFADYEGELAERELHNPSLKDVFLSSSEMQLGASLVAKLESQFNSVFFEKVRKDYLNKFDHLPLLKVLRLPILNIYGSEDVRVPARLMRKLEGKNLRQLEIEGAGHFPFLRENDLAQVSSAIKAHFN